MFSYIPTAYSPKRHKVTKPLFLYSEVRLHKIQFLGGIRKHSNLQKTNLNYLMSSYIGPMKAMANDALQQCGARGWDMSYPTPQRGFKRLSWWQCVSTGENRRISSPGVTDIGFEPLSPPYTSSFLSLSSFLCPLWKKLNTEFSPSSSLTLSPFLLIHIPEHPITPTEIVFPWGDHLVLKWLWFLYGSNKIIRENSVLPFHLFSNLISTKVISPIKWLLRIRYIKKHIFFCMF